jgi:three-Cys-motif partner protein
MPVPTETLWPIPPHTVAKHNLLRRYLGAWFGIMGSTQGNIIFLDGFCGPGRYKDGEEGSPIIALNLAIEHRVHHKFRQICFLFIDENKDRIEHLDEEINQLTIPSNFHVETRHNQFDETLTEILDTSEAKGSCLAPTFAFIDPFGPKGAPFSLVERLMDNPKTEVFINIMVDTVNRFLEHPNPQQRQHYVDLFGTDEVLSIADGAGDRITELRKLYQRQLETTAKYVRYFEMCDGNGRTIYFLFFATNNPLGHVKMKGAFWAIDKETGYQFSDATNPLQPALLRVDPSMDLGDYLQQKYSGTHCVGDILKHIENDTPYIEQHLKKALGLLEAHGKIVVSPIKINYKKRYGKSFPEDVIVTFP